MKNNATILIRESLNTFFFSLLICTAAFNCHGAEGPRLLPFQGRLTDQNGIAVSNGVRLVQFKIFAVPSGGSPVWAGELHRTTVNGGLVNVLLGSKTPFTGIDFDRQLSLEITVDINGDNAITAADPPMQPRQTILPVLFAKQAADSRFLNGHGWSSLFTDGSTDPAIGRIHGNRLMPQSVTATQLALRTIIGDRIATNTINSDHLASAIIGPLQLAQGAVTSNAIGNAQVIDRHIRNLSRLSTSAANPSNALVVDPSGNIGLGVERTSATINVSGDGEWSMWSLPFLRNNDQRRVRLRPDLPAVQISRQEGGYGLLGVDQNGGYLNLAYNNASANAYVRANILNDLRGEVWISDGNNNDILLRGDANLYMRRDSVTTIQLNGLSGQGTATAGWVNSSTRAIKRNFMPADSTDVLRRVISLPISTWSYTNDVANALHLGPVAEEFYQSFGLGTDNKVISTVDAAGVSLAAIQGLHKVLMEKDAEIRILRAALEELTRKVDRMGEFRGKADSHQ